MVQTLRIKKAAISIHALRGEGDDGNTNEPEEDNNFNPRPPWGGRQQKAPTDFLFSACLLYKRAQIAVLYCLKFLHLLQKQAVSTCSFVRT